MAKLAADIFVDVFRCIARRDLERVMRVTCREFAAAIDAHLPRQPHLVFTLHVGAKPLLGLGWPSSTKRESSTSTADAEGFRQSEKCIQLVGRDSRVVHNISFSRFCARFLQAPIPRYVRVTDARFEFDVATARYVGYIFRKLSDVFVDFPWDLVRVDVCELEFEQARPILDEVRASSIELVTREPLGTFFHALRACSFVRVWSLIDFENVSQLAQLVDWFHCAERVNASATALHIVAHDERQQEFCANVADTLVKALENRNDSNSATNFDVRVYPDESIITLRPNRWPLPPLVPLVICARRREISRDVQPCNTSNPFCVQCGRN